METLYTIIGIVFFLGILIGFVWIIRQYGKGALGDLVRRFWPIKQ